MNINMTDLKLDNENIMRYSRQLVLPEIGVTGQLKLQSSSVLIVGAGGLGCPAAIYLAAAGVGKLGVVDYDEVELNNLHRQVLHTENRLGRAKCESVTISCKSLNSNIQCVPYKLHLNRQNAMDIISQYDIVLDATDNVPSRYLLNDACVLCGKPLVSGSALRFEGQLTVYNYDDGPCYRCLYPTPPPPHTVTNCSDGGVLGVVPGIIGSMQALEAIKIITGIGSSFSRVMLLFDALDASFRHFKLRPKQPACAVCGSHPTVTTLIDYEQYCGSKATDKEYKSLLDEKRGHVLLDVRPAIELDICRLPHTTLNINFKHLDKAENLEKLEKAIGTTAHKAGCEEVSVIVVCHLGNDSQRAVAMLREKLLHRDYGIDVRDIAGGLDAWAVCVDHSFPRY